MGLVALNNQLDLRVLRRRNEATTAKPIVMPLMSKQGRSLTHFVGAKLKRLDQVSGNACGKA